MFSLRKKKNGGERYLTVMVIPEKSNRVQKLLVPLFLIKLGLVLFSVCTFFVIFVGLDYLNVLDQVAENKKLKGENFKLRQEMQQIKNKVDSMETTMDRVRTYAKKLQILTGQKDSEGLELPQGGPDRAPASREVVPEKKPALPLNGYWELDQKIDSLSQLTTFAEESLSKLEVKFLAKHALLEATPSLIPIVGWISSPFGYRRNPYDGKFRLHAGVDLAAEAGAPVRSPAPGIVVFSGYKEGYGKVVVMNHGYGISTVCAHLSRIFVNSGDRIRKTEILGEVGSTGHSTGPHLHYEIRKNGVPVNPTTFFARARF